MTSTSPRCTISLVTYNGARHLEACLLSIADQTLKDIELSIWDNGSTDSTKELIREHSPNARYSANDANCGFAVAHNAIISESTSEYICILNQDVWLSPDYLTLCIDWLDAHPECAEVTGTLFRCDSLTDRTVPVIVDSAGLSVVSRYFVRNADEGLSPPSTTVPLRRFGVSATAAVYRRSALEDVSLPRDDRREYFDEDFFMYKEDVDLSFRLRWRGWTAWHIPPAYAYHVRTKRLGLRADPLINYLSYRNMLLTWVKNISVGLLVRNWPAMAWFELLKIVYGVCREREIMKGLGDAARLFPAMRKKRAFIQKNRVITDAEMIRLFFL